MSDITFYEDSNREEHTQRKFFTGPEWPEFIEQVKKILDDFQPLDVESDGNYNSITVELRTAYRVTNVTTGDKTYHYQADIVRNDSKPLFKGQ